MWPLVALCTMDININPEYSWAMDSDIVVVSSPGHDVTMAPVGSAGHSNQLEPSSYMALESKYGLWSWPLVMAQIPGIHAALAGKRNFTSWPLLGHRQVPGHSLTPTIP